MAASRLFPYSEVCTTTTGAPHDARTTKVARTGYQADIPALRRMNPALMTLSAWLAERGWKPANA
jgi:hypothetical protein